MPTVLVPAQLTVKHLMAAVKQLSPAELDEFTLQFAAWQKRNSQNTNSQQADAEQALMQMAQAHLPATDTRRFKQLMAKSERGTLTPAVVLICASWRPIIEPTMHNSHARREGLWAKLKT